MNETLNKRILYVYAYKCPFMIPYYLQLGNKILLRTILLTLLGWLPGFFYAICLVKKYHHRFGQLKPE